MTSNMKLLKQEIRAEYKKKRRAIPPEVKAERDRKIFDFVLQMPAYQKAQALFCYVSLPDEVDTIPLLLDALSKGKQVCVPVSLPETCTVDFYEIHSLDDLRPGTYGVLEPDPLRCKKITSFSRNSICIVPGLVFDEEGFRLGYGKGYYDRFLQKYCGTRVGVCYREMRVKLLPHGYYDRPVHWLVSEDEIKRIRIVQGRNQGGRKQKQWHTAKRTGSANRSGARGGRKPHAGSGRNQGKNGIST